MGEPVCYEKKIAFDEIADIRICEFTCRGEDEDWRMNEAEILLRSGQIFKISRSYCVQDPREEDFMKKVNSVIPEIRALVLGHL